MLYTSEQPLTEDVSSTPKPNVAHLYLDKETEVKPSIAINISSVLRLLALTIFVLLVLHLLVVACYQLNFGVDAIKKFYFDQENSLPTYFSSLLLLMAAAILCLIAILKRNDKNEFAKHWAVPAVIFLGLSVDESASFHESLINPLKNAFQLTGFLRFSWVIAGGLFLIGFCLSYLKFFFALSPSMRLWFFLSGATYVFGVLGFEMIGGSLFIDTLLPSEQNLSYQITMTLEETLEMGGIVIFIFTLLSYIKAYSPKIDVSIS